MTRVNEGKLKIIMSAIILFKLCVLLAIRRQKEGVSCRNEEKLKIIMSAIILFNIMSRYTERMNPVMARTHEISLKIIMSAIILFKCILIK